MNSTKELSGLNTRLTSLVGPEDAHVEGADPAAPHPPIGLPDLVADMHAMVSEQKRRAEAEGMVGQRLDTLLQMMGAEQERHAGQQNSGFTFHVARQIELIGQPSSRLWVSWTVNGKTTRCFSGH